jgi:hypothetical protein
MGIAEARTFAPGETFPGAKDKAADSVFRFERKVPVESLFKTED